MTKVELQKFAIARDSSIVSAMKKIDENARGILYVLSKDDKLEGSITDGDIRRWILRTGGIDGRVSEAMNPKCKFLYEGEAGSAKNEIERYKINSVPIVNTEKAVVDIFFAEQAQYRLNGKSLVDTPVIVMAGGKGTRLYPYTKILPKPLIPIGETPILERILKKFNEFGVNDFYITVNYRKEMIKSYFKECDLPFNINYVEEDTPLGTAGSIRLINRKFDKPVFITNCDILIEVEYDKVLDYHKNTGNALTIVSSLKNVSIPYGVLHSKEHGIVTAMEEKPQLSYFINTGMYIINPEHLEKIPSNSFYHMTDLAEQLIKDGEKVGMYPISENSYLDMGQFDEMKRMEELLAGK